MPRNGPAFSLLVLAAGWLLASPAARADEPRAVATFHSIGLYWSPEGGGGDRPVHIRYRETGTDLWFTGLDMRYNPIDGTDQDLADYRGSLVHLRPGAEYRIELSLEGGTEIATLNASTWPEDFPVARTIPVSSSTSTLAVTESGTPDGYLLYDGAGAVIDVAGGEDYDVTVDASHVIIRGLILRGARRDGIRIFGGHDIVIEDCDISGWGRLDFDGDFGQNMDAAVFCSEETVVRVVVQRCLIHHPRHDSNSWAEYNCHSEGSCTNHPAGPQAIVFYNSAGNHVFRYNRVWSDADHYYNDIFGGGSNGSFVGFPGPDSDIYGNDLANCWDDGIETEGGCRNVRVWANHVDNTYLAYANAPVSIGPWYFWRNVSGRCYSPDDSQYGSYGPFIKMGYAGSVDWMTGHMYVFHNTVWNIDDAGCSGIGGSGRYIKHCVTRNNVLHVRSTAPRSIAVRSENVDNDFDYDLYSAEVPGGSEPHGLAEVPDYVPGAGYRPDSSSGDFQLREGSPGHDAAEPLPDFADYFLGDAPDLGAQETGSDPLVFGLEAGRPPVITGGDPPAAVVGEHYSHALEATGGRMPLRWTLIAGTLPPGLELAPEGTISGTAEQVGVFSFSVYARNADSLLDRADLDMTVLPAGPEEDGGAVDDDGGVVDGDGDGELEDGGDESGDVEGMPGTVSKVVGCGCAGAGGRGGLAGWPSWLLPLVMFKRRRSSSCSG